MFSYLVDIVLYLVVFLSISFSFQEIVVFSKNRLSAKIEDFKSDKENLNKISALKFFNRSVSNIRRLKLIGQVAPFVGLGGTVLHIVNALSGISGSSKDISVISGPISQSLVATGLGILASIIAYIAYSYFAPKYDEAFEVLELEIEQVLEQKG